ncbi:non-muscle caldesmon [Pundamilia nyererei]|uniref:Non-muscle caldesmon-like n=1 Tax=Pundamilia nyererei TaxID=303518 RepID=A0A9Y3VUM9_9CICH|nr:PREDICTED: non-muscle caldesmon-like [Pundamilia nyererei]XP_005748812.1 PREDICTED: non-muscle caldesmon-like [Pundamilia nyererei]XP_005748813.1 PREDICTED: non-muscle caldesmon-like [Pundamilia nyererei]
MSNALVRRNSSKQGLQNLMRLTAQRSIEDAEEVERERRRRARESLRRRNSGSAPGESSLDGEMPPEENTYGSSLKPNSSHSLEEDEGFSDWTQRRERRRQQRLQELSQGGYEDEYEEEDTIKKAVPIKSTKASITSLQLQRQEQEDRDRVEMERRKEHEEEMIRAERARREKEREEELRKKDELISRPHPELEKRKEVKISYTSKVFLHQEPKHSNSNGNAANEEVTSFITKTKRSTISAVCSRAAEPEESEAILETEQRLEKIRRSLQEKESQEMEQLRQRQAEAEQELEELKRRREDRRQVRQEEERRREEEELQRLAKEEEERRRMKEEIERRRMEAAERMKNLSTSSVDEDEMFSPFSPKVSTQKITERTESLNRSLKKSNSFKKTQPLLLTSKIDDKLEQYAHAVENSQEARAVKASLNDLPQSPEVVASKKNLFEAGEAWSQSPSKGATCKDTEGLKVGVANLINQWVKGPSDGSRQLSSRPADLRPGDVMQKKNMWEVIGDSLGRPGQNMKSSAANKKYKFVVTGHGKYEKIPVDDENEGTFTNGKSDLCHSDY